MPISKEKSSYLNASVIICGAVCLLRLVSHLVFQMQDWSRPMLIPGLTFLTELCYPLLFAWIGLLIRGAQGQSKWWMQLIVAAVSVFCLCRYCTWTADHWFSIHLHLAMLGFGYLIPPADLKLEEKRAGWTSFVMLLVAVICFTAVSVVKRRLDLGEVMPEFPDMEKLLEDLVRIVAPLLAIISAYFAIRFSFSSFAQKAGDNKWVRIFAVAFCVFSFLQALRFVLMTSFKWQYMAGNVYVYPLTFVLAQPVTIYLIYVASRLIAELWKPKADRLSWQECFKIF